MNKEELIKKKDMLNKKILTLEWDRRHNQIHVGQKDNLETFKQELADIETELQKV